MRLFSTSIAHLEMKVKLICGKIFSDRKGLASQHNIEL